MVAQPDPSPAVAPSATTMGSKRESSEGADLTGRSASVKSTRISDEAVEMLSPQQSPQPIGDFAALAATPATSVAPAAELAMPASAPTRTRAGARSQPPSLMVPEDSPSRHARRAAEAGHSRDTPSNIELRQLVDELAKGV